MATRKMPEATGWGLLRPQASHVVYTTTDPRGACLGRLKPSLPSRFGEWRRRRAVLALGVGHQAEYLALMLAELTAKQIRDFGHAGGDRVGASTHLAEHIIPKVLHVRN